VASLAPQGADDKSTPMAFTVFTSHWYTCVADQPRTSERNSITTSKTKYQAQ
jgi:hypothetical protein